ncbi:Hypothetical protein NTJ_13492 [Nesidiocoris tenuis]|uniref:Uncharacterized protein n=1 Tax=Nesidiocoris tenuis TaxID=355587 RepID=A0ABN7B8H2_9HEMI|nr:Hypothetical protein NTJ_13492 [Nesidiocoris tenuis]
MKTEKDKTIKQSSGNFAETRPQDKEGDGGRHGLRSQQTGKQMEFEIRPLFEETRSLMGKTCKEGDGRVSYCSWSGRACQDGGKRRIRSSVKQEED